MTEQECIGKLNILNDALNENFVNADECSYALQMGIEALEEIQQYRALGTVEELRVTRDKQVAKKPIVKDTVFYCSNCGGVLYAENYAIGFCSCGQKIKIFTDWSDEDE